MDGIGNYLKQITNSSVIPVVRLPMTGSYWTGYVTKAAEQNMKKYPNLSHQYQTMITKMVDYFTDLGAVTILDLHWNDDDTEQQSMALKSGVAATEFWSSVAEHFKDNDHVFYELYNEPHLDTDFQGSDVDEIFINGNNQYNGMLEMEVAVRQHAPDAMLVIAGAGSWAYDSQSLIALDSHLMSENVIYNFHPYMGPYQQGDARKAAAGFEVMVKDVQENTNKPVIITEFGQFCCPTDGECYKYPGEWNGQHMGYDEAILHISTQYNISWTPWAWRPTNRGDYEGDQCQDLNGMADAVHLSHPTDGKGADWATLWTKFSNLPPHTGAQTFLA